MHASIVPAKYTIDIREATNIMLQTLRSLHGAKELLQIGSPVAATHNVCQFIIGLACSKYLSAYRIHSIETALVQRQTWACRQARGGQERGYGQASCWTQCCFAWQAWPRLALEQPNRVSSGSVLANPSFGTL